SDRSRRAIAVIDRVVFPRERTVAVTEICPGTVGLVAPGIQTSISASGGFFPLGFGGQALAGPGAIRFGIVPAHLHDRMGLQPGDATPLTSGGAPIGVRDIDPRLLPSAYLPPAL